MELAGKLKYDLLADLADSESDLSRHYGVEMCGLWSVLVSECVIKWNNSFTRKAGRCRAWKRHPVTGEKRPSEIEMSWPLFRNYRKQNTAEFAETVLHELAHVMTPGAKHGALWISVALAIGSNGKRCHSLPLPRRRTDREKLLDRANNLNERISQLEEE